MQMHITSSNKLASIGTIGLLFLAGIAGIVFLLPFQSAHAAPTLALSTITSGVETAVTSATVGSALAIAGSGFASGKPVEITTTYGTTTVTWFNTASNCASAFTSAYGGLGTSNSLNIGGCVTTAANGNFKTIVTVPALPGGAQTITVSDGTNTGTTPITITPKVTFTVATGTVNLGFPEEGISATTTVSGFGASEQVTLTTTAFTTTSFTCTTTAAGSCTIQTGSLTVADVAGGAKTLSATGATSSLTATTTYTINPWAVFYNSAADVTTFSFIGTAPTSIILEAHGLTAGTVAANSITVGGSATNHASVVVGSGGTIYGLVVSPTTTVPYGLDSVVAGGATFSYAAGNIAMGSVALGTTAAVRTFAPWGGALISSIQGSGTTTGVVVTDSANYKPGSPAFPGTAASTTATSPAPQGNKIAFFGYGFVPASGSGGALSIATPTGAAFCTDATCTATGGSASFATGNGGGSTHADSNGAFFATVYLGDTPWSTSAAPSTAASYTATVSQLATAPANVLSPTFGITAWIDTSKGSIPSTTVDYTTTGETFMVHGFGATDGITATIGGTNLLSTTGVCTAPITSGACTTSAGQVPDLAGGKQNVAATGSVTGQKANATGALTYDPRVDFTTSPAVNTALNSIQGAPGSTTILRTGTSFGVHGLLANTAYSIVWNPNNGPTTVGTFTSTATGGIPVPGIQFTVPTDTTGIHIIDLQVTASLGTSAIFADTKTNCSGCFSATTTDLSLSDSVDTGVFAATVSTAFGDDLYSLLAGLVASPSAATVGSTVGITGSGLAASTVYDLGVSQAGTGTSGTPSTCSLSGLHSAIAPASIAGTFTSSSTGQVPSGVGVTLTDTPTFDDGEQGTLYCIFTYTPALFGTSTPTGTAQFLLQASAALNMTSAPSGHNVVITAHGLVASTGYNILFAPYVTGAFGAIGGTIVGAILTNTNGAGTATFTVPSNYLTQSGSQGVATGTSYTIQLQTTGDTDVALAAPPTVSVGSVGGQCTSQGTGCMTLSGQVSIQTISGYKTAVTSWTNNSNAPVTAIVYATARNAAGQTVLISTGTITASAGASATAYDVLFGLPSGTYTVNLFVTSTGGVAISTSSTATVTV
jgi:hypothetical protein